MIKNTNLTPFIDNLSNVNQEGSASDKLSIIHQEIKRHLPFIDRIAVVIYEEERDLLKTYICTDEDEKALQYYQNKLSDSQTLRDIANNGVPRVINDLAIFAQSKKTHSKNMAKRGFGASHTTPFYNNGHFAGLIFINSLETDVFDELSCHEMSPFIHLIGMLVCKEMDQVQILFGSVTTALDISHHRDPETGAHLERMSRYSRLIARELAPSHQLDDEYIEFIYRFAPMHDVGKVAIADSILLKPGKLTTEEYNEMKRHTVIGCEMINRMLSNFRLEKMEHTKMLRNIIELHHEAIDGSGYPRGLKGDEIPLEARIIAVADIFDALTSERPYKKSWTNDEAFAELKRISGSKVDRICVDALENSLPMVLEIQGHFQDDPLG